MVIIFMIEIALDTVFENNGVLFFLCRKLISKMVGHTYYGHSIETDAAQCVIIGHTFTILHTSYFIGHTLYINAQEITGTHH